MAVASDPANGGPDPSLRAPSTDLPPPEASPSPSPAEAAAPEAPADAPGADPAASNGEGEFAALEDEERLVEEAARRPAVGGAESSPRGRGDRTFLLAVLALGILLFFGWAGGTAILQLRRDVTALEARLAEVQADAQRAERLRARASLGRARADLEALRDALPPDLATELGPAFPALERLSRRLDRP